MKKKIFFCCCISIVCTFHAPAQTGLSDSSVILSDVTLNAFLQHRKLKEANALVNYISPAQLNRFNNTSVLPALNLTSGVRMEERSPASYRMNIRGSTLRSPFGVRNVKIYWNDLPLTDPGGNTYLNQLSFYDFNSIEIIKGPGSSLYGTGSGGVILINSLSQEWKKGEDISFIYGSYGLKNLNAQVRLGSDEHRNYINFTHQVYDGYRYHSAMRRDLVSWQTMIRCNDRQELKISALYGDLYYQTPGGLTQTEYNTNPRLARPKSGTLPSADTARAAIYQKTFLAGLSNTFYLNHNWQNNTVLYGAFTYFQNPTFRAYEKRTEPHFGGRSTFQWTHGLHSGELQWLSGMEAQKGFFNTSTFANLSGNPGAVQTNDDLNNWTWFVFTQANLHLNKDWNITGGISLNNSSITITRLSVANFKPVKRTYNSQWTPRLAVSKRIIKQVWLYAGLSKGFSPPTSAELLPGTVTINTTLQPEEGMNYEAGIKSSWLNGRLYAELSGFTYRLNNAIVSRKDSTNAVYYVNAGNTSQKGVEMQSYYDLLSRPHHFISGARLQFSYTHYDFHYSSFKQSTTDFSGKRLPSVAPNTVALAGDIMLKNKLYATLTWFYSDHLPLNDANTFFASSYQLLGAKIGWKKQLSTKVGIHIFAGADNLFNVTYSLGNDINASGDRYFNAAAGRNYFAGLALQLR